MTKGDYFIIAGLASAILFLGLKIQLAYSQEDGTNGYLTYENQTANFKMQYPIDWITETGKNLEHPEMLRIFPKEFISERIPSVGLTVGFGQGAPTANLTEVAEGVEASLEANPDVRLINITTGPNVTLANGTLPAVLSHAYDFSRPFVDMLEMAMTTVNNGDGYSLRYFSEPENFDKYLRQARKMIDSFQLFSNKSATPTPEQLLMIGESLYAEGKVTEAIGYYDKVLALAPNELGALYDKGLALDVLGLHGDAITYYDKLLSVYPNNINALINKGSALADLGRYSEAIEYFNRVLALEPNNVLAAENKQLAESLALTGSPYAVN